MAFWKRKVIEARADGHCWHATEQELCQTIGIDRLTGLARTEKKTQERCCHCDKVRWHWTRPEGHGHYIPNKELMLAESVEPCRKEPEPDWGY
jgi:hypothetical protein